MYSLRAQLLLVLSVVSSVCAPASGQGLPPATVPDCLATSSHDALAAERAKLVERRDALRSEVEQHNSKCRDVSVGTPLDAECAREQALLEAAVADYAHDKESFRDRVITEAQDELSTVEGRTLATRRELELQASRFKGFSNGIEEWNKLSDNGHRQLQATVSEAAVAIFLDGTAMKVDASTAILAADSKEIDRLLRERSFLLDLYDKARASGKISELKTYKDVVELLSIWSEGIAASHGRREMSDDEWEADLRSALDLIAITNSATAKNPAIGLLITDGELVIADLYAAGADYEARQRVQQIMDCEEAQLEGLKRVTKLYTECFKTAKCLRAYLSSTGATPKSTRK